jgi:hypothetical protein
MNNLILRLALVAFAACGADSYNVVWDSPGKDCHGSLPLGGTATSV